MRRFICLGITILLLCSMVAFAAGKPPLSDRQLAAVTAGDGYSFDGSGNVVASNSTATVVNTPIVVLTDQVQQNAEGVNIFNSTDSKVAAGFNALVLGGSTASPDVTDAKVQQSNVISQQSPQGATMTDFYRGANLSIASLHQTALTFDIGGQKASDDFTKTSTLTATATSATTANLAVGVTGTSDKTFAGSASKSQGAATNTINLPGVTDNTSYNGGGSIALAGSDTTTVTGNLTASYANNKAFALDASSAVSNDFSEASFFAKGSYESLSASGVDYKGPVGIGSAAGQNIVVDGSSLTATEVDTLTLDDNVQQNIKGVNIVNAVSSLVGIGNNIAVANNASALASTGLCQKNVIIQK